MNALPESQLVQIAEVLFKWKHAIALFAVATALVALLFSSPSYRAKTQLLLQVGREHVVDASLPTGGAVLPSVRFELDEQTVLATEMLSGNSLARDLVAKLGPDTIYPGVSRQADERVSAIDIAAGRLREGLKVATAGRSTLIGVSFEHADPMIAAQVVNALADAFIERHIAILKDRDQIDFMHDEVESTRRQLEEHERALAAFKLEHRLASGSLSKERNSLATQLSHLQLDQVNVGAEVEGSARRLKMLEDLERENHDLNSGRFNQLPAAASGDYMRESVASRSAANRLNSIAAAVRRLENRLRELDGLSTEFDRLSSQVEQGRARSKLQIEELTRAEVSDAMDSRGLSSVRVIERATPPTEPISSRRALLALALVAGIAGGVVWALLLEFAFGRIDTTSDVQRYLGMVPIAALPEVRGEVP